MFTGIVQTQANVLSTIYNDASLKLTISVEKNFIEQLQHGASIAINGVCLTVVNFSLIDNNKATILFDVIDETLRVTNLKRISTNDTVNFERSLKVGDEIGGHMVSGHIHSKANVSDLVKTPTNCKITFMCNTQLMKYILPKGFITINGTSLTVGDVTDSTFCVHLIPETLSITNLGKLSINDIINIELDQQTVTIVDTIERLKLSLT